MVPSAILKNRTREAWELVERFSKLFGDRYYLELQRHGIPEQDVVNRELLRIHEELRIPLIATNDCHYLHAGDAHSHEALLCVQTGKTLDDPNRFRFNGAGFYVKSAREMLEFVEGLSACGATEILDFAEGFRGGERARARTELCFGVLEAVARRTVETPGPTAEIWLDCFDRIAEARREMLRRNLNPQLVVEGLLLALRADLGAAAA